MAAFVCFSNSEEKITDSYRALIQRLKQQANKEGDKPTTFSIASYKHFSTHKARLQRDYKNFIFNVTIKMLDMTGLLICDNPTPIFKHFVQLIEREKLQDGLRSCAYYGEIKKIVTSFINYYTFTIDDVVKKIDKYTYFLDNKLFIKLIDATISMFEQNQADFLEEYLPLNTEQENINYQLVIDGHEKYILTLKQMRETWEFRQDKLDVIAKEMFKLSLKKISYLCTYVHTYISLLLSDRLYEIAVSIVESVDRMTTNLRKYNEQCTEKKKSLIEDLYEKNKERMEIFRRQRERSIDSAEVHRTIDVLKDKIENYGNAETFARLELEIRYWNKRLNDYNEIASILTKIRLELDSLEVDEAKFNSIKSAELSGAKTMCFELIGENLRERISYLNENLLHMSKALITFFCVRGTDRVLYTDSIGSYYCDEFNHQNYITNYGLKYFHANCYGEYMENLEKEPYYFDDDGRYILKEGEKIHQCAPCTSKYKLGEDGLLKKITKDCGHSERDNPNCRASIKDLTDVVILPKCDLIDTSGTLDHASAKYLWDNFGMVLPEALYAIAQRQPKNPIHYMGHLLLRRRLEATTTELRKLRKMADKVRAKYYQDRRDKAEKERRAWKQASVKRLRPELFDETQQQTAVYNQHVADHYTSLAEYYIM